MDETRPDHPEQPPRWDDVVNRLDRLDRRPAIAVARSLYRAVEATVSAPHSGRGYPIERRRLAALTVRDALAAYRLAGGDPDHLHRVVVFPVVAGDVVAPLGDRARLARARIELAFRDVDDDNADDHAAHVADVEQRAAALERPGAHQLTPDDFDPGHVSTPGELAAAHDGDFDLPA